MPLPQFSMMLSLTINSRVGEVTRIAVEPNRSIWLATIWHWSAPPRLRPAPIAIATDLLRLAASPVVVLVSLLPSIQMPSPAQLMPLPVMLMELRLIFIDDRDTPRPRALMAVPAQPTISLPMMRVLSRCNTVPVSVTAACPHQNTLSSTASAAVTRDFGGAASPAGGTATGSLARIADEAMIAFSEIF